MQLLRFKLYSDPRSSKPCCLGSVSRVGARVKVQVPLVIKGQGVVSWLAGFEVTSYFFLYDDMSLMLAASWGSND